MTLFKAPLRIGDINSGNPQTETRGFVPCMKIVLLSQAQPRMIVSLPPSSTLLKLGAVPTSAFTGTDPVSAMNVNFGNSADSQHYGVVVVSANSQLRETTLVSAATDFDASGATIVVTLSALSTTVFTGGGVRAFIHYVTTG